MARAASLQEVRFIEQEKNISDRGNCMCKGPGMGKDILRTQKQKQKQKQCSPNTVKKSMRQGEKERQKLAGTSLAVLARNADLLLNVVGTFRRF